VRPGGLFLGFYFRLRAHGLRVTPRQWLALFDGLARGLHGASLMGFYSLARCLLVKDESELDDFDQAFAEHFRGVPEALPDLEAEVLAWLESPIPPHVIDPALREVLDAVDVEALRAELERRLQEQKERHDGGNYWIGTGGTSAFGNAGYHPGGIRIGGQRGHGSAVQVAAQRRHREHRRDLVLDTRQLAVALRKLRALSRQGPAEELDLEATIDRTAREAGELSLIFQPPRQNELAVLLVMDVGGSMEPYRRLVDVLFSATHRARHFKRLAHAYFHNCVYDRVYEDAAFERPVPLGELFRRFEPDTRLVLVGDAHMYPGELLDRHGSIQWTERNEEPGIAYLRRLGAHFRHAAWLNPMHPRMWAAPSVTIVRNVFEMYPLTVEGVDALARALARGASAGRRAAAHR
jgi:hypothetical protein